LDIESFIAINKAVDDTTLYLILAIIKKGEEKPLYSDISEKQ